jgi:2-aminophenol/2-amino-5-chlorophenol 1,6-dioxygenase beta subunit
VQTELFGSIASIHPFDNEAEALGRAQARRYERAVSIWTQDRERALCLSHELDVGMVCKHREIPMSVAADVPSVPIKGAVVAGALAPHPPHLIYAENPPLNEPRSECGWEVLRWGYEDLRKRITPDLYDVIIVHSPHWKTISATHILACEHFSGLSVDPNFPHLFRFQYDLSVDVGLAKIIHERCQAAGLETELMLNPDFPVDYGTIISCHLLNPSWDKPIIALSSHQVHQAFSNEVGQAVMTALGEATRAAVCASGRRALVVASCSLSHRHFTSESAVPEDMSAERIYSHNQYLWDMHMLKLIREGDSERIKAELPDFITCSTSEIADGSFSWMLAALNQPGLKGIVHAYGTVIGTGNAVVSWLPQGCQHG